ncbi:hypothetical protein B0H15DRAFT_252777 [Mycena belliarum]|uniref:Uncharacterized protein n=1 Tax=Mycena belliarum TaxID=1033014 RepID=A0AAD6U6W9_9AGAR|nr:hypothetical protein B0H15DRAFT_252777 [Mycena belliae]
MKSSFGIGAICGVPLYFALMVSSRRPRKFSMERLLNVSTLSGVGVAVAGGAVAFSRNALSDAATLKQRRVELAYSASQRREDDFGTIGAILGACLAPAIFWTRAGLLDLTLGGGTLGYGGGFLTHHWQTSTGSPAGQSKSEIPSDDPRMRRR